MSDEKDPTADTTSREVITLWDWKLPEGSSMKSMQLFFDFADGHVDRLEFPYRFDSLGQYIAVASKIVFGQVTDENTVEVRSDRQRLAIARSQLQAETMNYENVIKEYPKKLAKLEAELPKEQPLTSLQMVSNELSNRLGGLIYPPYKSPRLREQENDMMNKKDWRPTNEKAAAAIENDKKKLKEQHEAMNADFLLTIRSASERATGIQKTLDSLKLIQDKIDTPPSGRVDALKKQRYIRQRQALREKIIPYTEATRDMSRHLAVLITVYMAAHHIAEPELHADAEILFQYAQPLNSKNEIVKNMKTMQVWCEQNPEKVMDALDIYFKSRPTSLGRRSNAFQQI